MGIRVIKGTLEKLPKGTKVRVVNNAAYLKQLAQLEPGMYEFTIQPIESKLKQMKKAYFVMEGQLARHLGYKKVQLHSQLKDYIGHHISPENGRPEYLSIARVNSEEEMMQRILELQEFAAEELNYVFPPYEPPK